MAELTASLYFSVHVNVKHLLNCVLVFWFVSSCGPTNLLWLVVWAVSCIESYPQHLTCNLFSPIYKMTLVSTLARSNNMIIIRFYQLPANTSVHVNSIPTVDYVFQHFSIICFSRFLHNNFVKRHCYENLMLQFEPKICVFKFIHGQESFAGNSPWRKLFFPIYHYFTIISTTYDTWKTCAGSLVVFDGKCVDWFLSPLLCYLFNIWENLRN